MNAEIWAIIGSIAALLIMYTKVIFDYATIKATLNGNTALLVKIEALFGNYDLRIKNNETDIVALQTLAGMKTDRRTHE